MSIFSIFQAAYIFVLMLKYSENGITVDRAFSDLFGKFLVPMKLG